MGNSHFAPAVGDRFGRLVVQQLGIRKSPNGVSRGIARCVCDCGAERDVLVQNLKERTRSCGCLKQRGTMSETFRQTRRRWPRVLETQPGDRFERLVVLDEIREGGIWRSRCLCDCGEITTVAVTNLHGGLVRSCGCLQSERAAEVNSQRATHGLSDHPHYSRWSNMMRRCHDPESPRYPEWGGRGIKVCPQWHDVAVYVRYLDEVLGPRPEGYSLDRIDNNGDYEPGNVRWASVMTQRYNQRRMQP